MTSRAYTPPHKGFRLPMLQGSSLVLDFGPVRLAREMSSPIETDGLDGSWELRFPLRKDTEGHRNLGSGP